MVRSATRADIQTIAALKLKMFQELGMGHLLCDNFIEKVENNYNKLYESSKAIHFLIEENEKIIACAGAFIKEDLPYCFYKENQYGFIGDVFVEPDYRNQGYARS